MLGGRMLREGWLAWLVAACGLLLTAAAYRASSSQRERQLREDFAFRVRDARTRIETRLGAYEQVLLATKGHMAGGIPARASFRAFVEASRVHQRFPGVQGVGFGLYVPKAEKAAHVQAVRAEGFPDYQVVPAGERDAYAVVTFLEPFEGRNLRAFGFDMYHELTRRAALDLAWQLDDTTITGKVTLLQETDKDVQAGFLMYVPLFEKGGRLLGWIYTPFRMNDFMAGVLGERADDLDIDIFDGEVLSADRVMFGKAVGPEPRGHLEAREQLHFGHHTWTLHVHPRPTLAARLGADPSPLVALSGFGVTALLALLTWTLLHSRARAVDLYRRMLHDAKDAVLIHAPDGQIREANPQASTHFGYTYDELTHMNVADLYGEGEREGVRRRLGQVVVNRNLSFETTHRRKDGSRINTAVSTNFVAGPGEPTVIAFCRDITERIRAEQELAELNRSLERRIREAVDELRAKDQLLVTQSRHAAMGEMLANIAHQWRQPLNALSLLLANLKDAQVDGELDDKTVDETLSGANRLIQKMSSTITDFREFFRPQKEKSAFSVREQVDAVLGLVGPSLQKHGIQVRVEAERDVTLFGYPNEYSQVLLNLVSNAKDAMEHGGQLVVRIEEREGLGAVTVRDEGGGIPQAILDKMFEPYFSTKPMGTGIGLYMSKQIIERNMGGRIEVRNVDKGAELTVLAPLS